MRFEAQNTPVKVTLYFGIIANFLVNQGFCPPNQLVMNSYIEVDELSIWWGKSSTILTLTLYLYRVPLLSRARGFLTRRRRCANGHFFWYPDCSRWV